MLAIVELVVGGLLDQVLPFQKVYCKRQTLPLIQLARKVYLTSIRELVWMNASHLHTIARSSEKKEISIDV